MKAELLDCLIRDKTIFATLRIERSIYYVSGIQSGDLSLRWCPHKSSSSSSGEGKSGGAPVGSEKGSVEGE